MRSGCFGHAEVAVHTSALIGPEVEFGPGTEVGPFCRFEGRVSVGARCWFAPGVIVGSRPMDYKYRGETTEVRIGTNNQFFEYATVHRSCGEGTSTVIGDNNMVMAYVHIAHNCRIGSGCVLTNGVQLAGHVEVGDGANIGGLAGVHQFCRIGKLAMVGACSYVSKDIPPFVLAAGNPCRVRGLNTVGLKRAGFSSEELAALRHAFRLVYRSGLNLTQALARIESELLAGHEPGRQHVAVLAGFLGSSCRGIELRSSQQR
ncbi:MAG: acyl-ACP--UDP-N-acetylglucosamine O-acyltransferase [candidate division WOR-3 bacterium]